MKSSFLERASKIAKLSAKNQNISPKSIKTIPKRVASITNSENSETCISILQKSIFYKTLHVLGKDSTQQY